MMPNGKAATALANLCAAETGDVVHGRSTTTIARSAVRGAYIVCCRIAPEEFEQIALVWNRWTTMARALSDDEIARTTCTSCRKEGC